MHVRAKGMADTRIRPILIHLAQAIVPNYAQVCLLPWVLPTHTSTTQTITYFFQISMATTALHTMVIILSYESHQNENEAQLVEGKRNLVMQQRFVTPKISPNFNLKKI
jgi:hypothetical protein